MSVQGPLDHIDMSIRDPDRSIPFYAAFFGALGYTRIAIDLPDFRGERPRRATWAVRYPGGAWFGIEVRPARPESRDTAVDRYAPGLHHMAFHAASREEVDRVHAAVRDAGGTVLDPPTDYSGQDGYSPGYYAVFFADPDGIKLEVLHQPLTNP
ncbi:MAG: VOC family protein [Myxococcota bacterium]|nr:VOC family protein [Myxococcota bacterium]